MDEEIEDEEITAPHKGYGGSIMPLDASSNLPVSLTMGTVVVVYIASPHCDWYIGEVERCNGGHLFHVRFRQDGALLEDLPLSARSYGRFNLWVLPDVAMPDEAWVESAHEHRLLGRLCEHGGREGMLRMWCIPRRIFALAVLEPGTSFEREVQLSETEAECGVQLVTDRVVSEVDGVQLHLSSSSVTGYRGVSRQKCFATPFYVR